MQSTNLTEFILYSYADQVIPDVWVSWSDGVLSLQNKSDSFQLALGSTNSNDRTRAVELYKLGLLKGTLTGNRAGNRESMPTGWAMLQDGKSVHSRLGLLAFIVGKAQKNGCNEEVVVSAFSALCCIFCLQMGIVYEGKSVTYLTLYNYLLHSFPKPIGASEMEWKRMIAIAMFSTIKSDKPEEILIPFFDNKPIEYLYIYTEDGKITLTAENIDDLISSKRVSIAKVIPRKHFLFWLGDVNNQRGIYSYASKSGYNFLLKAFSIEMAAISQNQTNPFLQLIQKQKAGEQPCILEVLDKITQNNQSIQQEYNQLMETLYIGAKAALKFIAPSTISAPISHTTLQSILYGAPGTGKSYALQALTQGSPIFRTTFHPELDFHGFVGGYRPTMKGEGADEKITYQYVPQVFMQAYTAAWNNPAQMHYLVIEEINRGNCAAIFGDLFQLLDRDSDGFSEYSIAADAEQAKYLEEAMPNAYADLVMSLYETKTGVELDDPYSILILPNNLSIVATMNTADQSLYPMDSAFKRRWDWEYCPIDYAKADEIKIKIDDAHYNWGAFLRSVNQKIYTLTHSEDKQLGTFFAKAKNGVIAQNVFCNKVLFFLWNDLLKDENPNDVNNFFKDQNGKPFTFTQLHQTDTETKIRCIFEHLNVPAL